MRYFYLIILTLIMSGCDDKVTSDVTAKYVLPPGMESCSMYNLATTEGYSGPKVIVCDNATTNSIEYQSGKTTTQMHLVNKNNAKRPTATKEECETTLPRNQSCVAVWVPAAVETK